MKIVIRKNYTKEKINKRKELWNWYGDCFIVLVCQGMKKLEGKVGGG